MAHLPRRRIFSENLLIQLVLFIHTYLHSKTQSYGPKMIHLDRNFFGKTVIIIFICLLVPFIDQKLKKIHSADPELWGWSIFGPEMIQLTPKIFFSENPLINKPCSFHSCLSTFQKSKSDVNPLMRYWLLKKTEISLAGNILGHNLRTRFFTGMQFSQNVNGL